MSPLSSIGHMSRLVLIRIDTIMSDKGAYVSYVSVAVCFVTWLQKN